MQICHVEKVRPHSNGAYVSVPHVRAVYTCVGMHRCSVYPHADSPITVRWDAVAKWTQPLLLIRHPCGCTAANAPRVCSQLCTHMYVTLRAAGVSLQLLCPNWQLWDCLHKDEWNSCAYLCRYMWPSHRTWMHTPRVNKALRHQYIYYH